MHSSPNKSLSRCFTLLALFFSLPVFAKGSEQLAVQFLDISGINAIYAQGIVVGYKNHAITSNTPLDVIECFTSKITPQLTMQPLAAGYASEFNDQELQSAISFFKSETGNKYAIYQRVKSSEIFGIAPQEKEPEFSSHDLELTETFLQTRIGKLIISTNSPVSATAKNILKPKLSTYLNQCKKSY